MSKTCLTMVIAKVSSDIMEPSHPDGDPQPKITDPRAMRALSHPLRIALMEILGAEGTATASRCAELLGESHASCSFHLRQLAKYGFVEEAESEDRRERPWRLVTIRQNIAAVQPDIASTVAADQLARVFVQRDAERAMHWIDTHHDQPEEWRRASFSAGAMLPVTPEELDAIGDRIRDVIEPYVARIEDPSLRPDGARWVRVYSAGFPSDPGMMKE